MTVGLLIGILLGLAVGIALGVLWRARHQDGALAESKLALGRLADVQSHLSQVTHRYDEAADTLAETRADNARLQAELTEARRGIEERTRAWEEDREHLRGTFAELSSKALEANTQRLITISDSKLKEAQEAARGELGQRQEAISQMVAPLRDLLTQYEAGLREMELDRKGAYTGLTEQVKQLASAQDQLKRETQNLVTALRAPQTAGPVGRDAAAPGGRARGHGRALRLQRAGHHRDRGRADPPGPDRAHRRSEGRGRRRQGPARRVPSGDRGRRRGRRGAPS